MMKIRWFGHSCFLLTGTSGVRVLTDPFNEKVGYPVPAVQADIVTVSHQHFDHNHTAVVQGRFTVFDSPGSYTTHGVEIHGFPTFHDDDQGHQRGNNVLFRISLDGLTVVHCGDLGHMLTREQGESIGQVDVLLLPVGGTYTIGCAEAVELMRLLRPVITIPMHYRTPAMSFPIQQVDPFIQAAGGASRPGTPEITLDADTLERMAGVVVLDAPA